MEAKKEKMVEQEEERKIPVLTVLKNGAILKNIFVINNPESIAPERNGRRGDQEAEETLVVGRHPDCNIMLTHPSISRFHLQILSNPSCQKLFVTDLSSVHGTWVSDQKIEPGIRVEVKEYDAIRIGGSTRIYRLHWIPLSRAYDVDNPFVSLMDVSMAEEQEEENAVLEAENAAVTREMIQGDKPEPDDDKIPSLDMISEGIGSLFSSEDSGLIVNKEILSAPLMSLSNLPFDNNGDESRSCNDTLVKDISATARASMTQNQQHGKETKILPEFYINIIPEGDIKRDSTGKGQSCSLLMGESVIAEVDNKSLPQEYNRQPEVIPRQVTESMNSSLSVDEFSSEIKAKQNQEPLLAWQALSEIKNEGNHTTDQNPNSAAEMDLEEIFEEAKNLSLLEGHEQREQRSYVSATDERQYSVVNMDSEERFEAANSLSLSENLEQSQQKGFVSVMLAPEESDNSSPPAEEIPSGITRNKGNQTPQSHAVAGVLSERFEAANSLSLSENHEQSQQKDFVSITFAAEESVNSSPPAEEIPSGITRNKENQTPQSHAVAGVLSEIENSQSSHTRSANRSSTHNIWSRRCKSASILQIQTNKGKGKIRRAGGIGEAELQKQEGINDKSISTPLHSDSEKPEPEIFTPDKENLTPSTLMLKCVQEIGKIKENKSSSKLARRPFPLRIPFSHDTLSNESIISDSEKSEPEIFTPDKENVIPSTLMLKRLQEIGKVKENKSSSKVAHRPFPLNIPFSYDTRSKVNIISDSEKLEPEIFTPDKENLTPNSHTLKRLQDLGKLEENKSYSRTSRRPFSSKVAFSPDIQSEENGIAALEKENQTLRNVQEETMIAASEKEKQTSGILQEKKPTICTSRSQVKLEEEAVSSKRKAQRVPFQSLSEKSPAKSGSFAGASTAVARSSSSVNCSQTMEKRIGHPSSINSVGKSKRRWTIVVDDTSLLDKESRKSLQLLKGLRGTQLVIPRAVIRELDSLKRRGSLFRRTTEVSSVLEWIEECLVTTKWWIHVQCSVEEAGAVAPTPPASPMFLFSDGARSSSSIPFSVNKNSEDIFSPTAEDHILDCALLYRKKHSDGQLVLLSNDVTLKIKAVAEGLICEAASEFYESLANPFSERFLWAESSPRGQTWSHLDDVVLRERYNNRKKSSKGESAKGLKLILLHNSHYGASHHLLSIAF